MSRKVAPGIVKVWTIYNDVIFDRKKKWEFVHHLFKRVFGGFQKILWLSDTQMQKNKHVILFNMGIERNVNMKLNLLKHGQSKGLLR